MMNKCLGTLILLGAAACASEAIVPANDIDPKIDLGETPPEQVDGGTKASSSNKDTKTKKIPKDAGVDSSSIVSEPGAPREDRFAMTIVSFKPGACAGFGSELMPGVVLGPPVGGGREKGSLDVLSLGNGGEIILSFDANAIVDGPGVDFLVFENAFYANGDPTKPYVERAEVSVSEDGVTWATFPCTATAAPYGACAGWHPVLAETASDALDPEKAGGEGYDLADVNLTRARFVRIKDMTTQRCTSQGPNTNGFDLDGIAAVHAEFP